MNLVRFAIDRPIAVIAAVLMVVLFGLVALETIPIMEYVWERTKRVLAKEELLRGHE